MGRDLQTDESQFRAELGKVIDYVRRPHAQQPAITVIDAPSAYRDMEATLGLVPGFFRQFPEAGIAGAWREFKTIQLNPHSALQGKYKELIGPLPHRSRAATASSSTPRRPASMAPPMPRSARR